MASSAASALPAWVNRWGWGPSANGSPTCSYYQPPIPQPITTESHYHRIILSISREISLSIAHESHHDLSRTREFFFFARGLCFLTSRSLIDFAMIGVHRLNKYSSSFNPFAESLSITIRIALCGFQVTYYHRYWASLFTGHLQSEQ